MLIKNKKTLLLLIIFFSLVLFFVFNDYLALGKIQSNIHLIKNYYIDKPSFFIFYFMISYVLITSLSIPGALLLTLLAGSIFDLILGTIIVGLSASVGALISFNLSRYFFKESVMYRFKNQFSYIDKHLQKDEIIFLFMIRLFPASPFGILNLILGLTSINSWRFFWITALSMIPGNLIYVYAGKRIGEIKDIKDVIDLSTLIILLVIAVLPFLFRKIFYLISRLK